MDIKYKRKVNKEIAKICNEFTGELNCESVWQRMAYKIKCFLEKENIDFETVDLYTTPERVDDGITDIRIDGELYPLESVEEINNDNWSEYIFDWENGELSVGDTIKLFQFLIDEGHAWNLQGFYGRTAEDLIQGGYCTLSYKETHGHYIWGTPKLPTKFELRPGAPGTDEYVKKRKELDDDDFFEWSNLQINYEDEDLNDVEYTDSNFNQLLEELDTLGIQKERIERFKSHHNDSSTSYRWALKNIIGLSDDDIDHLESRTKV